MAPAIGGTGLGHWSARAYHRNWLLSQASGLFDFFQHNSVNPKGGFYDLDDHGKPLDAEGQVRSIHIASRAVHCFSIGVLLGRPGAASVVDHGMDHLWNRHRDKKYGGYFWSVNNNGPVDSNKQGYGHAFVLLAASSAKTIGHPLADGMLADITEILNTKFWEPQHGAIAEEFTADWQPLDGGAYRGQNSNMHLTEALMAAFEATGDKEYLAKAAQSMALGWDDDKGGFFYTLDWDDKPAKRNKLWWPACEGAGAAHFLNEHLPSDFHEQSYRKIWNVIERAFIDHENGGWHEELTEDLVPSHSLFPGKGDIYHALQACLIPLFPATGSLTKGIIEAGGRI
jgi:mannose/cellobiose epimerase-like protein (N-acyl-D-glucosamine 2-epimerase family)